MATISAYRNGVTANISPNRVSAHERAKRGVVKGWSREAVRRHTKFLYSVDSEALNGYGYALTLTVRDCPATAREWQAVRRSLLKRLQRRGLIRLHWLTEWQRRGVPHLHMAAYFGHKLTPLEVAGVLMHWADVTEAYASSMSAQDIKPIDGPTGWLQYLSKHAARGVAHYQRQGSPEGWETTGRLWGTAGDWPTDEALKFKVPQSAWYRFRRIVRAWRIADARKEKDPKVRAARLRSARRMLSHHEQKVSSVRGISQWLDQDDLVRVLALFADQDIEVRQLDT